MNEARRMVDSKGSTKKPVVAAKVWQQEETSVEESREGLLQLRTVHFAGVFLCLIIAGLTARVVIGFGSNDALALPSSIVPIEKNPPANETLLPTANEQQQLPSRVPPLEPVQRNESTVAPFETGYWQRPTPTEVPVKSFQPSPVTVVTAFPSVVPTYAPSSLPTKPRTSWPSSAPSIIPTSTFTVAPSEFQSFMPSPRPSLTPSFLTASPEILPSATPSFRPTLSIEPTTSPPVTRAPTFRPTPVPVRAPTPRPNIISSESNYHPAPVHSGNREGSSGSDSSHYCGEHD